GVEALRAGRSVIVFPEGTRVSPGERGKYASSGAELAVRAGVPLVPIAHNAGVYWRRRSFIKQPGCIQVVIGSTLATSGRSAPDLIREVEQWIEKTVAGLPGGTPPGH
ncbi:MAG: lysophospholipid acyltransferase family protein, partial [Pseudomonadota bacterium]